MNNRFRVRPILPLALALALLLACGGEGAGDVSPSESPDSLLQLLPGDADSYTFADLEQVRDGRLDEIEDRLADLFDEDRLGNWEIDLDDAETVLLADPSSARGDTLTILSGRFDREDIEDALDDAGLRDGDYRGVVIWSQRQGGTALALVGDDIIVIGEEDRVEESIEVFADDSRSMAHDDEAEELVEVLEDALVHSVTEECDYRGCDRRGSGLRVDDRELLAVFAFLFRDDDAAADAQGDIEDDLEDELDDISVIADGRMVLATSETREERVDLGRNGFLAFRPGEESPERPVATASLIAVEPTPIPPATTPPLTGHAYWKWHRYVKPDVHEDFTGYIPQLSDFPQPPDSGYYDGLADDELFLLEPHIAYENSVVGFRTWLYHEGYGEYSVGIRGDDGVALYANGVFVAGRGAARDPASYGLMELYDGWNKIEALVYNGPTYIELELTPALGTLGVLDANAQAHSPPPRSVPEPTEAPAPTVAPAVPADDHGDDPSSASFIRVNEEVYGEIAHSGDRDFFYFHAERGREYSIENLQSSIGEIVLVLSGPDWEQVWGYLIDDYSIFEPIKWSADSSDAYFLEVRGYGSSDVGTYRLIIEGVERPAPTAVPQPTAQPLTEEDKYFLIQEYAREHANGPGAIYFGDIAHLAGPAPTVDQGDFNGDVPLESLERHLWIYESPFYNELLDRARLFDPTPMAYDRGTITIEHACINRALLPCRLLETYFAPNLLERTDGRLRFNIRSYPELGVSGPDTMSLVRNGALESATIHNAYEAGQIPGIEIQNLWGIYDSREQEFEVTHGIIKDIEDLVLSETGGVIMNHSWYADNDHYFFCLGKIDPLEGFEDWKIRTHSPALSDWITGMGAEAIFVGFVEVYDALERGFVDCGATRADAGHERRWYEFTNYLIGPLSSIPFANNVINAEKWASIPDDLQKIILEEAAKSELEALRLAAIQNEIGLIKNQEAGLELVDFSPELKWRSFNVAAMQYVIPGWLERLGYPGSGRNAVALFNNKVGPYVGLRIEPDGLVRQVPITEGSTPSRQ